MARSKRQVRLTGGGPTWDKRPPKDRSRAPALVSTVPEADAAMALSETLLALEAALNRGKLSEARRLRGRAWDLVELLQPWQTRRQRQELGRQKQRIKAATEAEKNQRRKV